MKARRFRIAFSFTGEKRDFVAQMAAILAEQFSESAILYDKFHESEFARGNLGIYLPDLYHDEADLIVVVAGLDYDRKEWCGLEWAAIHDLLKQRQVQEVMLTRFNQASIKGIYGTAGWIELDDKTPQQGVTLILERLALNEHYPKDYYTNLSTKEDRHLRATIKNIPQAPRSFVRSVKLNTIPEALDPTSPKVSDESGDTVEWFDKLIKYRALVSIGILLIAGALFFQIFDKTAHIKPNVVIAMHAPDKSSTMSNSSLPQEEKNYWQYNKAH